MFSHIIKNWRARLLESLEVIVNLIAYTTIQRRLIKMSMKKKLKLMMKYYKTSI